MSEEQFINDFYNGSDYRKFAVLKKMYRENQQLQEKLNILNNEIDRFIEIIQQQPSKDDSYLLEKLNSFKFIIRGE